MAEYIAKERVIEEIEGMDNCGCITRSVNHVCEDIRSIPTADVVERSKIDKAIEEMKQYILEEECNGNHEKGIMFALEILERNGVCKRNIGESE